MGVPAGREVPATGRRGRLGAERPRPLRRREGHGRRADPRAGSRPRRLDPPPDVRPDGPAAHARGRRSLRDRDRPGRLRPARREAAGVPGVRRAVGAALARPGPVRRLRRLPHRRLPAGRVALPRLRHRGVQRRQALRPLREGATRRRRTLPRRPGRAGRHRLPAARHLRVQQPRRARPVGDVAQRRDRHHGRRVPGRRVAVRPLPRPQVRPALAERLLPPASLLRRHHAARRPGRGDRRRARGPRGQAHGVGGGDGDPAGRDRGPRSPVPGQGGRGGHRQVPARSPGDDPQAGGRPRPARTPARRAGLPAGDLRARTARTHAEGGRQGPRPGPAARPGEVRRPEAAAAAGRARRHRRRPGCPADDGPEEGSDAGRAGVPQCPRRVAGHDTDRRRGAGHDRPAGGAGELADAAGQPADGPRAGQPRLAAALRQGPGGERQRLRPARRPTHAPGTARLPGGAVRRRRLEYQEAAPRDSPVGDLPAECHAPRPRRRPARRPGEQVTLARRGAAARRRTDPRRALRRRRRPRREGRRPRRRQHRPAPLGVHEGHAQQPRPAARRVRRPVRLPECVVARHHNDPRPVALAHQQPDPPASLPGVRRPLEARRAGRRRPPGGPRLPAGIRSRPDGRRGDGGRGVRSGSNEASRSDEGGVGDGRVRGRQDTPPRRPGRRLQARRPRVRGSADRRGLEGRLHDRGVPVGPVGRGHRRGADRGRQVGRGREAPRLGSRRHRQGQPPQAADAGPATRRHEARRHRRRGGGVRRPPRRPEQAVLPGRRGEARARQNAGAGDVLAERPVERRRTAARGHRRPRHHRRPR